MAAPSILVVGATGNTGHAVIEELSASGASFTALARSDRARIWLQTRGVPTVAGDLDDEGSLVDALQAHDKAYLVCTPDRHLLRRETAFVRAAVRAGVRHIVKCSAYTASPDAKTTILRAHGAVERALAESGIGYTLLRPTGFMQTFTFFAWDLIQRAGVISNPTGTGGIPLVDLRDVAKVAVKALLEPGHEGVAYDITGPEVLAGDRIAEILETTLGRPVTYLAANPFVFRCMLVALGVPREPREHVVITMRMTRDGELGKVETTLERLGIRPTTYAECLQDYVAGRTRGGSSFDLRHGAFMRAVTSMMPALLRARFRLLGRPSRTVPRLHA